MIANGIFFDIFNLDQAKNAVKISLIRKM